MLQLNGLLEANVYIKINAIPNVTVDKVMMGSSNLAHTFAFTDAGIAAASAG